MNKLNNDKFKELYNSLSDKDKKYIGDQLKINEDLNFGPWCKFVNNLYHYVLNINPLVKEINFTDWIKYFYKQEQNKYV